MTPTAPTQVAGTPTAAETAGVKILPVFLVIDTSWSMRGDRLAAAEKLAPELLNVCLEDPTVRDKVRIELITFNSRAEVVIASAKASDVQGLPTMHASSGTNYSAAFALLRDRVEEVSRAIRADGFQVLRPAVFFLSDGEPIDSEADRAESFASLTSGAFPFRPNICMFGVGEAGEEAIAPYKHGKGIAVHVGGDAPVALARIIPLITQSVISTAMADGGGLVIDPGALDDLDDVWVYD